MAKKIESGVRSADINTKLVDEKVLDKGIWLASIYGTNKQGVQKEFIGYKGRTSGGTIGFDVGFENVNDLLGIAYTKLDSKFKSKGKNLNTKIDSHIVALYGQKELPKNFFIFITGSNCRRR